jgi:hypothetical protein
VTVERVDALLAANREIQALCERQLLGIRTGLTANMKLRVG